MGEVKEMPFTTISLDRERKLRFDYAAGIAFEERYGHGIIHAMNDSGFRVTNLLLWAGLLSFQKSITPQKTAEILQHCVDRGDDINEITKTVVRALLESGIMGHVTEEDLPGAMGKALGTGDQS